LRPGTVKRNGGLPIEFGYGCNHFVGLADLTLYERIPAPKGISTAISLTPRRALW
jgi:hypothetical protein